MMTMVFSLFTKRPESETSRVQFKVAMDLSSARHQARVLCPDRDTRLDVSARYLWVQCVQWFNVFSGSMVQWFRRGLDDQVETEGERDQRKFSGDDELSEYDKDKAKVYYRY